jgi:hypothetical protein
MLSYFLQICYSNHLLPSHPVALLKSEFSYGDGGKDRNQDTPVGNLTEVAKFCREWLVWVGKAEGSSRRMRLPEFLDNRHMKVAKLSALRSGRLYPQEIFLVLIYVRR